MATHREASGHHGPRLPKLLGSGLTPRRRLRGGLVAAVGLPLLTLVLTRPLLKIWGPKYVDDTHYLRQYMAQLRRKLEPDPARPRHLLTELGMGYRYQP
jgi:hypothetical protein